LLEQLEHLLQLLVVGYVVLRVLDAREVEDLLHHPTSTDDQLGGKLLHGLRGLGGFEQLAQAHHGLAELLVDLNEHHDFLAHGLVGLVRIGELDSEVESSRDLVHIG